MSMQLDKAIKNSFLQLSNSLEQLTDEQYSMPSKILFNASIGQHTRHVIELFIELNKGYETGVVNYENRKRDYRIETDRRIASGLLGAIYSSLDRPDKMLMLESNYDEGSEEVIIVETNYLREMIYNLEHTVHHLALIRVGINEVASIELPESFGVASSTVKYRKVCAQ